MTRWDKLVEEALSKLLDVDFDIPQLNVVMKERGQGIAERLATWADSLPWEEWAEE